MRAMQDVLASRLVAATLLHRAAKAALDVAYDEVHMSQLFTHPGTRVMAYLGDEQIGVVCVERPGVTAAITDEEAFLAWAEERHPEWVEHGQHAPTAAAPPRPFRRVHPHRVQEILYSVRVHEHGEWIDEKHQERLTPPGITRREVAPGRAPIQVKRAPGAEAVVTRVATTPAVACAMGDVFAALTDLDDAPDGQRGECLDQLADTVRALRTLTTA